jgi:hypothetical protein
MSYPTQDLCAYDDCPEEHPVVIDDRDRVTCSTCRDAMGLDALTEHQIQYRDREGTISYEYVPGTDGGDAVHMLECWLGDEIAVLAINGREQRQARKDQSI